MEWCNKSETYREYHAQAQYDVQVQYKTFRKQDPNRDIGFSRRESERPSIRIRTFTVVSYPYCSNCLCILLSVYCSLNSMLFRKKANISKKKSFLKTKLIQKII